MALADLGPMIAQVSADTDVENSALKLINGMGAAIQAGIDAAIAGGATAASLKPVQDAVDAQKAASDALAAAVAANTPAPPAP